LILKIVASAPKFLLHSFALGDVSGNMNGTDQLPLIVKKGCGGDEEIPSEVVHMHFSHVFPAIRQSE
jgi:hypothetical protein